MTLPPALMTRIFTYPLSTAYSIRDHISVRYIFPSLPTPNTGLRSVPVTNAHEGSEDALGALRVT